MTFRPSARSPGGAPMATACMPGTRHSPEGSGRCCRARSASASCIFGRFDHMAELACYAEGAQFLALARQRGVLARSSCGRRLVLASPATSPVATPLAPRVRLVVFPRRESSSVIFTPNIGTKTPRDGASSFRLRILAVSSLISHVLTACPYGCGHDEVMRALRLRCTKARALGAKTR